MSLLSPNFQTVISKKFNDDKICNKYVKAINTFRYLPRLGNWSSMGSVNKTRIFFEEAIIVLLSLSNAIDEMHTPGRPRWLMKQSLKATLESRKTPARAPADIFNNFGNPEISNFGISRENQISVL